MRWCCLPMKFLLLKVFLKLHLFSSFGCYSLACKLYYVRAQLAACLCLKMTWAPRCLKLTLSRAFSAKQFYIVLRRKHQSRFVVRCAKTWRAINIVYTYLLFLKHASCDHTRETYFTNHDPHKKNFALDLSKKETNLRFWKLHRLCNSATTSNNHMKTIIKSSPEFLLVANCLIFPASLKQIEESSQLELRNWPQPS